MMCFVSFSPEYMFVTRLATVELSSTSLVKDVVL
jgi:hypothetical protein